MFKTLVFFFCLSLFLPQNAISKTITHKLGTTKIEKNPKRIVVLEFSFLDALAALEVSPVGVADDKKRERIGKEYTNVIGHDWKSVGTRKAPSLEVIASLKPDLIIGDEKRHASVYQLLSQIAPTIILDSLSGDYQNSLSNFKVVGKALNKSKEAEARIEEHRKKMKQISKVLEGKKSFSMQFGITNQKALWLHGPNSYNGSLLRFLGFKNKMKSGQSKNIAKTSLEQFSELNPDVFVLGKYRKDTLVERWSGEVLYKKLNSVKNNRVFNVDANRWTRMRGIIAAELKAKDLVELMAKIK